MKNAGASMRIFRHGACAQTAVALSKRETEMDYIAFSRKFFAATGIPVNLLCDGSPVYSSLGELAGFMPEDKWQMYPFTRNPEFTAIDPDLEHDASRSRGHRTTCLSGLLLPPA